VEVNRICNDKLCRRSLVVDLWS